MHNSKSESAPAAEPQPPTTRRKDASPSRVPVPIKSTASAVPAKPDMSLQKDTKDPKEAAKNAQKPIKKLATFAKPNISNVVSRIDSGVKATNTSTTSNTSSSSTVPAAPVIAKKPPSAATLKRQQSLAQLKSSTTSSNPVPSTPSIKKSVSTSSLSDTAKKPAVPAFKRMPSSLGLRKPVSADAKVKNVVSAAAVVNPPASAVKPRSRTNSIRPTVTKAVAAVVPPATLRIENERLKRENEELKQKLEDLTMKIARMPMISNEPTQPVQPAEPILEHPATHPLVNQPSHEVQIEDEDAIKEDAMGATAILQDEEPPAQTVDEEETYGAEEFEVDEVKMSTVEFKETVNFEAAKESLMSQTSLASGDFVVVSEKHVSIALPDADSTSESTEWDVTKSTRKNAARKARKKSVVAALAFGDLDGSKKEMFEGAVAAAAVAEAAEAEAFAVAAAVAEGRSLRSRKPKV
ncbi:hypothetical protein BJ741DRAFT_594283 [Chytriomyces cf. hyalinus JEL632]|nr:hypothetical protein BJ741DRAFT_594283 [Chytriomyces cf. hyalinus JEL632]